MQESEPTSKFSLSDPCALTTAALTRTGVRRDHAQLEKMRQLGMSVEDEYKLSALREYIAKVAAARQACVFVFPARTNALSGS